MVPILRDFSDDYINAEDQESQMRVVTKMTTEMQQLTFDANQDLIKIKQQTNTIRLIASDKVIEKLDMLSLAFDKSMEDSNKTMRDLPILMLNDDKLKMQENQKQLEESGKNVNKNNEELIALMREDLNEI